MIAVAIFIVLTIVLACVTVWRVTFHPTQDLLNGFLMGLLAMAFVGIWVTAAILHMN